MIWLLICFVIDPIIAVINCNPIITEGRKLNIYLFFIIQSYFAVPKNVRLNCTHYLIIKIPNKREL